jgi:hypothetical protein
MKGLCCVLTTTEHIGSRLAEQFKVQKERRFLGLSSLYVAHMEKQQKQIKCRLKCPWEKLLRCHRRRWVILKCILKTQGPMGISVDVEMDFRSL